MNDNTQALIHLEGITKVFFTDEVETHALSAIDMEVRRGEFVAIAGPFRLWQIDPAFDPRPARFTHRRKLHPQQQPGGEPRFRRAGAHSQPQRRLHLPKL